MRSGRRGHTGWKIYVVIFLAIYFICLPDLQYGQWVIIHHAQFDFSHESGPYHSTQILLNADSKEFIIRVWGREESYTYYVQCSQI